MIFLLFSRIDICTCFDALYFEHNYYVASAQDEIGALEKAESELMQIERDMRSAEEVSFHYDLCPFHCSNI